MFVLALKEHPQILYGKDSGKFQGYEYIDLVAQSLKKLKQENNKTKQ